MRAPRLAPSRGLLYHRPVHDDPLGAPLQQSDPETAAAIGAEVRRQDETLVLIASENFASCAVMEATGSVLTNKYAEGYPGRRYYGGCENADAVERLAIARARALFGAEHANVQPHSGAQANMAVYLALLKPGDTLLGMDLAHGGHLTHGHPLNISGRYFRCIGYGVDRETEIIDYDQVARLAREHRPRLIIGGASAYSRIVDYACLRSIADEVGARLMADTAHVAGLIAAGVHPNPLPHVDVMTTTTHKTLRGPRGALILCRERLAKEIDAAVFPGIQGGPLMNVIAAKAVAFREAAGEAFRRDQKRTLENAALLAGELAAGRLRIVSGGTDTHMFLIDLRPLRLTGRAAEQRLERLGIALNKNTVPFDPEKPMVTSGVRLGSPACTTRGFGPGEFRQVADLICEVLDGLSKSNGDNSATEAAVAAKVEALTARFPIYN